MNALNVLHCRALWLIHDRRHPFSLSYKMKKKLIQTGCSMRNFRPWRNAWERLALALQQKLSKESHLFATSSQARIRTALFAWRALGYGKKSKLCPHVFTCSIQIALIRPFKYRRNARFALKKLSLIDYSPLI